MATPKILQDIQNLPPEAQKQVSDFVAFLKERYAPVPGTPNQKNRRVRLAKEPFIGMWKGRADMHDSVEWVRQLRQTQWGRK
jgi:mRNA-degrading endonuclease RelE of RelBE toxin-antitoxin system